MIEVMKSIPQVLRIVVVVEKKLQERRLILPELVQGCEPLIHGVSKDGISDDFLSHKIQLFFLGRLRAEGSRAVDEVSGPVVVEATKDCEFPFFVGITRLAVEFEFHDRGKFVGLRDGFRYLES